MRSIEDIIEEISKLPSVGINPYVPLEGVIKILLDSGWPDDSKVYQFCNGCKEYDQENHCCHRFTRVIRDTVKDLEEEYKPKYGYWVEHHEPYTWMGYTHWSCSKCGFGNKEENKIRSDFCPVCGARMVDKEVMNILISKSIGE